MERQGWAVELFPLMFQKQPVVHGEASAWMERAHRLPFLSARILADQLRCAFSRPAVYFSTLFEIFIGNIEYPRFLIRSLAFFPKVVSMARVMEKEGIRHIHAHYATYPALAAWVIHRLTGIPYTVTVHAHDIFESKPMLGEKLKTASRIVAISRFNREYLAGFLGDWIEEKTSVVHCGIRPESYHSISPSPDPTGRLEVLHIGSLEPYKGQKYLIEACRILKEKRVPVMAGVIGMGFCRGALVKKIENLGLEAEVRLLGPKTQEEVAALLPQAHCYVQPSIITKEGTMEGIPVALMEAMCCGLPVIATAISGIPELVEDGLTGILIPPEDPQALAAALERIHDDYAAALEMGLRGRAKVLAEFDLHQNVMELGRIIAQFHL